MDEHTIALSTNDYKNLSRDPFGQSHYFELYHLDGSSVKKVDIRENVLFRQACGLRGRAEHLHGLLGDVQYLVGTEFEVEVKQALEDRGHRILTVPGGSTTAAIKQLHATYARQQSV